MIKNVHAIGALYLIDSNISTQKVLPTAEANPRDRPASWYS